MKSVLLGKKNKRYEYFSKACTDLNVDFEFFDIDEYFEKNLEKLFYENFSHQACFIKPNFGSGACGVISLKYNKKTDKIKIQTSMNCENGRFINTKKLFNISDKDMICKLVNFILKKGAIIERWIPKDDINGIVYDLRLVYQFENLDFIQARGSKKGSITNLHLNNMPLDKSSINLTDEIKQDIDTLCQKAMEQFPNLNVAGFDILLEKNTKKPYIIEINSQGDLMYKDIFDKNIIYKNQIIKMNILVEKLKLK